MTDGKDDQDGKGPKRVFHSRRLPGRKLAPSVVPTVPPSLDDTVGAAIFDQERSWLRAEIDRSDNAYLIITIGIAVPPVAISQLPDSSKGWMRDNPDGMKGYRALGAILEIAWILRGFGSLLLGRWDRPLDEIYSIMARGDIIDRIDRSVAESFAEGVSVSLDVSDKPTVAELVVRFRRLPGIAEERPLSVKGHRVLNESMVILGKMLETTMNATRASTEESP